MGAMQKQFVSSILRFHAKISWLDRNYKSPRLFSLVYGFHGGRSTHHPNITCIYDNSERFSNFAPVKSDIRTPAGSWAIWPKPGLQLDGIHHALNAQMVDCEHATWHFIHGDHPSLLRICILRFIFNAIFLLPFQSLVNSYFVSSHI
jgi:hypothetical protein